MWSSHFYLTVEAAHFLLAQTRRQPRGSHPLRYSPFRWFLKNSFLNFIELKCSFHWKRECLHPLRCCIYFRFVSLVIYNNLKLLKILLWIKNNLIISIYYIIDDIIQDSRRSRYPWQPFAHSSHRRQCKRHCSCVWLDGELTADRLLADRVYDVNKLPRVGGTPKPWSGHSSYVWQVDPTGIRRTYV